MCSDRIILLQNLYVLSKIRDDRGLRQAAIERLYCMDSSSMNRLGTLGVMFVSNQPPWCFHQFLSPKVDLIDPFIC